VIAQKETGGAGLEREATSPLRAKPVYLQPGQIVVVTACHILTILGSCVSVCLLDSVSGVGGMNHFLLPRGPSGSDSARFGDVALPRLLQQVLAIGGARASLRAKVFGGARVLAQPSAARDLGAENVQVAVHFLEAEGIAILAQHTGGTRGRKLIFQTADGVAWLKTF
jgi:chemotaxis protein CheD